MRSNYHFLSPTPILSLFYHTHARQMTPHAAPHAMHSLQKNTLKKSCRVTLRRASLSLQLFFKVAEMIRRVCKTVSRVANVEMLLICHWNDKIYFEVRRYFNESLLEAAEVVIRGGASSILPLDTAK